MQFYPNSTVILTVIVVTKLDYTRDNEDIIILGIIVTC